MKTALCAVLAVVLSASASPAAAAGLRSPGESFPEWKLVDQSGKVVSSTEFAGKSYFMWFYPKAMTAG